MSRGVPEFSVGRPPFPSIPLPVPHLPFLSRRHSLQYTFLWNHCKRPQWGPAQSPSRKCTVGAFTSEPRKLRLVTANCSFLLNKMCTHLSTFDCAMNATVTLLGYGTGSLSLVCPEFSVSCTIHLGHFMYF